MTERPGSLAARQRRPLQRLDNHTSKELLVTAGLFLLSGVGYSPNHETGPGLGQEYLLMPGILMAVGVAIVIIGCCGPEAGKAE